MPDPRFEMVISEVFHITDRPVIVSGPSSPTALRQGELVEILCDNYVSATTRAFVELHTRPGTTSLVLLDVAASDVEPGFVLRAAGR
ncbi:hypothetical protein AB0C04_29415 [Micromonospora sp. NPDC048909]|uniref:hypothetical protein n=1 Tax=Micromonospora sp. NPDC048909 TaxID=3155643 RepID=UPI0033F95FB8